MEHKRFFIIIYSISYEVGNVLNIVNSNLNWVQPDGRFPNRKLIQEEIKTLMPLGGMKKEALISNIMELSESDWNDYIAELP